MDNAGTTPLSKNVLEAMMPYLTTVYGNASSVHQVGREAKKALEQARKSIAKNLNASPQEIYFTSGGTESDNWAIKGVARANKHKGNHIITSAIEHHAVLHTCASLEEEGFNVTYLPVDENGLVNPMNVENAITEQTILISIMAANNEIGTIEPIEEIAKIASSHHVLFHTDAVQAMGALPVDVTRWNVDLLSMSAHKLHGPKGVGVLYIKKSAHVANLLDGGSQERGRRATTENVAGAVGMAFALQSTIDCMKESNEKCLSMRTRLMEGIQKAFPDVRINGHLEKRLPGNLNISIPYVDDEPVLLRLDLMGICCSSGSACTSGAIESSHVLQAIGLPDDLPYASLRFSLSAENTMEEVEEVLSVLPTIVQNLREMSQAYKRVHAE